MGPVSVWRRRREQLRCGEVAGVCGFSCAVLVLLIGGAGVFTVAGSDGGVAWVALSWRPPNILFLAVESGDFCFSLRGVSTGVFAELRPWRRLRCCREAGCLEARRLGRAGAAASSSLLVFVLCRFLRGCSGVVKFVGAAIRRIVYLLLANGREISFSPVVGACSSSVLFEVPMVDISSPIFAGEKTTDMLLVVSDSSQLVC